MGQEKRQVKGQRWGVSGAQGHSWHQRLVACSGLGSSSPAEIDLLLVEPASIEATLKIHRSEKQISASKGFITISSIVVLTSSSTVFCLAGGRAVVFEARYLWADLCVLTGCGAISLPLNQDT